MELYGYEVDNEEYAIEHYYDTCGQEVEAINPDSNDIHDFGRL